MTRNFREDQLLLSQYYSRYYPFKEVTDWIRGPTRDVAVFLPTVEGSQRCIRPVQISTELDLVSWLTKQSSMPYRVDIGAIYSEPLSQKGLVCNSEPEWISREFVIDIDMDDYDSVRTCCSGKAVCAKCWKFLFVAAEILKLFFEEKFAASRMVFVYSGGRGLHIWVYGQGIESSLLPLRAALANVMSLESIMKPTPWNTLIRRTVTDLCRVHWEEILRTQKFFTTGSAVSVAEKALNMKLMPEVAHAIAVANVNGVSDIDYYVWTHITSQGSTFPAEKFMLICMYPRLDLNVSKDPKHLLKAPFSVHNATGRISIPLDYTELYSFDPEKCLTIDSLTNDSRTEIKRRAEFLKTD